MLDTTVVIAAGDLARIRRLAERLRTECGKSSEDSLRWGVINLCQSLRHETPKAPKRRKVRKIRASRHTGNVEVGYQDWRGGAPRQKTFWAASLADAKRDPRLAIGKWGLAKRSWGWLMSRLFPDAPRGGDPANPRAVVTPAMAAAQMRRDGDELAAELHDRLDYIGRITGPKVAVAIGSAERKMAHLLDRRAAEIAARENA